MELVIISALTTLAGVLVGYLAGYSKKKGENRAMHEDIDKLTDQLAAVTTTTKKIEAKISIEMWDRQKRWELKRDILFEATRRVSEVECALELFASVLQVEINREGKIDPDLVKESNKYLLRWHSASSALDETRFFVAVACEREAKAAFDAFGTFTKAIAAGISKKDNGLYEKSRADLTQKRIAVRSAIRNELGINGLNEEAS
jgi:hypothetical protein